MQDQQQQNKPRSAKAVNPFNGEVLSEHAYLSEREIQQKLELSWNTFQVYRKTSIELRSQKLLKLSEVLLCNKEKIAKTIALEQGKAIKESRAEVEKAAKHAKYYSEHLEEYSKPEELPSEAKRSYVVFQPLGPIFHVTPFNFPFWLIFKGVIPAIAMGNTIINKNPSICPQTGILAEEAFREAGFVDGEFQNLIVGQQHSELIISSKHIRGVSFTGSSAGGSEIAALGGKHFKKTVMELGGSDPFIVLKDADLEYAADQGWQSRLRNSGQVCTAAKRFIVDESVYEEFKQILISKVSKLKLGDPLAEDTQIGPLAKREGLLSTIDQVERAKKAGAKVLLGGEQPTDETLKKGHFYLPTILEVEEGNPVMTEETFGPVFALIKFKAGDEQEAIRIANDTEYGLAGAIFSKDEARAEELAREVEAGYLAINQLATSGSSVPSGGVKNSGFGRENGRYGAHEFVNIKTIWIGKVPETKK